MGRRKTQENAFSTSTILSSALSEFYWPKIAFMVGNQHSCLADIKRESKKACQQLTRVFSFPMDFKGSQKGPVNAQLTIRH
jgi:hypothetical protein